MALIIWVQKQRVKSWNKVFSKGNICICVSLWVSQQSSPAIGCTAFLVPRTKGLHHNGDIRRKEEPLGRKTSGRVWRKMRRGRRGRKVSVGVEVTRWSFNDPCGENGPLQQMLKRHSKKHRKKMGKKRAEHRWTKHRFYRKLDIWKTATKDSEYLFRWGDVRICRKTCWE